MSDKTSTIDTQEVNKFAQDAVDWWNKQGPLKTLHDINDTRLEFIKQHVDLDKASVLDVGCGGGILSEALAKAGASVSGLDAQASAIAVAKEHAQSNELTIDYHCMAIEEFKAPHFDVITCMEMLEHVQNPEVVIAHCRRLLKPNGVLFLSTISRSLKAYTGAIILAEYVLNILPRQTHDYAKFIKPSELVAMTRASNFELIDLTGVSYNPISRSASLCDDPSVNYMLAVQLAD